ncbi:MAG: iron permease, partial [Pelagibacterales bacterium]|nr:iron permease [Pelagibacterales bacterium]
AALMIGWTVLWMQKHAKSISKELKNLSNSIREGKKPLYILLVVVFLSVLRESAEIVLFTYSYYISGTGVKEILLALILGIIAGSIVGIALYLGIIKAFGKYFFIITTWLLVFLASGIASQGVGFWVNADIIPAFGTPIFDMSNILSQESIFGKFLNMFFGYIDQPSGMQFLVYITTLLTLIIGLRIAKKA